LARTPSAHMVTVRLNTSQSPCGLPALTIGSSGRPGWHRACRKGMAKWHRY